MYRQKPIAYWYQKVFNPHYRYYPNIIKKRWNHTNTGGNHLWHSQGSKSLQPGSELLRRFFRKHKHYFGANAFALWALVLRLILRFFLQIFLEAKTTNLRCLWMVTESALLRFKDVDIWKCKITFRNWNTNSINGFHLKPALFPRMLTWLFVL